VCTVRLPLLIRGAVGSVCHAPYGEHITRTFFAHCTERVGGQWEVAGARLFIDRSQAELWAEQWKDEDPANRKFEVVAKVYG
jgi:hypothetical protein